MTVFLHIVLFPFYFISLLYCGLVRLRNYFYSMGLLEVRDAGRKVISVGNLTVGGTGKTPTVELIARKLRERGLRPVVISRGYGRKKGAHIGVVCNGKELLMGPADAGDEPYMLARKLRDVPVLVGSDRSAVCRYALTMFDPDFFILDDGYQHLRLKRDVNILLIDGERGFGNGCIFPRGPLREPLSGMKRADIVLINKPQKDGDNKPLSLIKSGVPELPLFRGGYSPEALISLAGSEKAGLDKLDGARVCALSAIANPSSFSDLLLSLGAEVVMERIYPDHHSYTGDDVRALLKVVSERDVSMIVMTEKDAVKLQRFNIDSNIPLFYLAVALDLKGDDDSFIEAIISKAAAGKN